jgi:hypothetical protein
VIVEYKNLENKGIWRIREFGEYRNLENIYEFGETIEARLWNLKKARPN